MIAQFTIEEWFFMQGTIDMHNHILWGIDDGAKNINESIEIIKDEYKQGVRKIIVTPHFYQGVYSFDKDQYDRRFNELCAEVNKLYPDLEIFKGQEIMYTQDIKSLLQNNGIQRMADSKYVLVEFMVDISYSNLERSVKEILTEGYVPIIAHCERYKCLSKSVPKIRHLVESGAYMQVNASTVTSLGKRHFVNNLIDNDLLHFVGTDAHNTGSRGVTFAKCVSYLERKYGEEYVEWLMVENPQKIINDEYI